MTPSSLPSSGVSTEPSAVQVVAGQCLAACADGARGLACRECSRDLAVVAPGRVPLVAEQDELSACGVRLVRMLPDDQVGLAPFLGRGAGLVEALEVAGERFQRSHDILRIREVVEIDFYEGIEVDAERRRE